MSSRLFSRLNRELIQEAGVSLPDYEVLDALVRAPDERMRAYELGTELQWEKSRLSHHLKRMENRELVERVVCETDGRGLWVTLTERGRGVVAEAAPVHTAQVRRLFLNSLDEDHMTAIAEAGEKVVADLPDDAAICDN